MTEPHCLVNIDALLLGRLEDFFGFASVNGEGLFAEDILPCVDSGKQVPLVEAVRGPYVHAIDIGVVVDLFVAGVDRGLRCAILDMLGGEIFAFL